MRTRRLVAALTVLAATATVAGCGRPDPGLACRPIAGAATTPLTDDRGALSARVWLPVVRARGAYRTWLEPLDVASRSLTTAELADILATAGEDRDARIQAAVSDIPAAPHEPVSASADQPSRSGLTYAVLVPSSPPGAAVGSFYATALQRQGHLVQVTSVGRQDVLGAVSRGGAGTVALLELPDLARALGALLPSTPVAGQVGAVAGVAAERSLALGSPSAADRTPQVLVTREFAAAHGNLVDLSGLARACPGLAVTATSDAVRFLGPLTAAYGLGAGGTDRGAVGELRAGQVAAVLAPAVPPG